MEEIMNDRVLRILEYNKIISLLVDKASSAPGKECCQKLTPMTDIGKIEEAQQQTADAFTRLVKGGRIHFSGNKDISFSIKSLEIGSALSAGELLKIAASLSCAARAKHLPARSAARKSRTAFRLILKILNR